MELINKKDALHAVLHNTGDAAVAAIQNIKPINPHGELREMLIDEMIDRANRPNNNEELIKALRCESCMNDEHPRCESCEYGVVVCHGRREDVYGCDSRRIENDAADAIERLTAEVDRKDKAIQWLLTQIEHKDKAIERMRDLMKHYKAAYRTAYKLYQEARNEQQP